MYPRKGILRNTGMTSKTRAPQLKKQWLFQHIHRTGKITLFRHNRYESPKARTQELSFLIRHFIPSSLRIKSRTDYITSLPNHNTSLDHNLGQTTILRNLTKLNKF